MRRYRWKFREAKVAKVCGTVTQRGRYQKENPRNLHRCLSLDSFRLTSSLVCEKENTMRLGKTLLRRECLQRSYNARKFLELTQALRCFWCPSERVKRPHWINGSLSRDLRGSVLAVELNWLWIKASVQFSSVAQSCLTLCDTMDCSRSGPPSITNSRSLPKLMSIESVMPSNHLTLCRALLLLPSSFPSTRVFSNESALRIRWPKFWRGYTYTYLKHT